MTEIVNGVLNLTFGFLANRARSRISDRLKDGDVSYEECRSMITGELDDIKSKLGGLARKDLLCSLLFLQDGINELYQSILYCQSFEIDAMESNSVRQASSILTIGSSIDTAPESQINDAFALINAVNSLKMHSKKKFKSATEKFKLAYENATKAFSNDTLAIEDRIQASQVRIMATILEKLENPDAALRSCLDFLRQLYTIGIIRETFCVLIDGGIMSLIQKNRRFKIASCVHLSNRLLFNFAQNFTNLRLVMFDWPTILFGNKVYHPLFGEVRFHTNLERFGVADISLEPDFTFHATIDQARSVVNSKTEIVAQRQHPTNGETLTIFHRSGESRKFCTCKVPEQEGASECRVIALDIDAEDNLFLVVGFHEGYYQPFSFKLFIFDKNGAKRLEYVLPFLQNTYWPHASISVSREGKVAILDQNSGTTYIGNCCDEFSNFNVNTSFQVNKVSIFRRNKTPPRLLQVRYLNNKIILASVSRTLYICAEDGRVEHKFKIPERNAVIDSIAINYVTGRILVKVSNKEQVYRFSETGEFIDSLCLGSNEWIHDAVLTSHPNGVVALIGKTEATFLQL